MKAKSGFAKRPLTLDLFIKAGVPLGSLLRSLFFLIHINDIICHINPSIWLFADDTSVYNVVENLIC